MKNFIFILNIFSKIFSKIFQKYFKNISPKEITKAIKKEVNVACDIPFAPLGSKTS
jgi:hypothetical protein